uniref:Uncharacterized protein n=1 Tax=Roseihalotalea indica TaxID=2867963 RepID=A0AA49JE63_9BACT|nr:hypothetical protein K4G66_02840 [Tunicatimonas sp. TK19036]
MIKALSIVLILFFSLESVWAQLNAPPSLVPLLEKNYPFPENLSTLLVPQRNFKRPACYAFIKDLQESYGSNKELQNECLLPSLVALSFYPELKNTKIRFVLSDTKTTLAARPRLLSLFRGRKNRSYCIFIDQAVQDQQGVLLEEMSFNAQVGGLGHEYAHILDYQNRSGFNVLWLGIKYLLSRKAKATLEKAVDKRTIERGLGWQALAWEYYILHQSDASDRYKRYKENIYLAPEEILFYIHSFPIYQHIQ